MTTEPEVAEPEVDAMMDAMGLGPTISYMIANHFESDDENYNAPMHHIKMTAMLGRVGILEETSVVTQILDQVSVFINHFIKEMGYNPRISASLCDMGEDMAQYLRNAGMEMEEFANRCEAAAHDVVMKHEGEGNLNVFNFESYVHIGLCQIILEETGYAG